MRKINVGFTFILFFALVGCNLPAGQSTPDSSPDAISTRAAETVSAELTRVALLASPTPNVPTNTPTSTVTNTPIPTDTPVYTPTNTPIPCNLAGFIADVTVPDNTIMSPNQAFVKTWRLRNIGTCTWTSAYIVSFLNGDGMGISVGYSQSLTSVPVPPNGTVDISVNLTAPASNGTYTGNWSIREPGGQAFKTNFIVKIKVVTSVMLSLSPVAGESGTIRSDAGPFPDYTAGESNADITRTCEAFFSFDISSIPANATITEVKVNLTAYTTEGNPFSLGVLNMYLTDYGSTLKPADFVAGFPAGNIVDWGSTTALNKIESSLELKAALQKKVGTTRLQVRLQFPGSNGNAVKDRLTFTDPKLIINYVTP